MSAYRQHDLVTTHNERVEQIMDAVEALLDNGFIIAKRLPDNPLNPVDPGRGDDVAGFAACMALQQHRLLGAGANRQ